MLFSLILFLERLVDIQALFAIIVQLRHFPTMTQNANQADGNQIMSNKMMDVTVYPLTSAATMNAKL